VKKTLLLMIMTATMALADAPWLEESIEAAWDVQLQLRNDYEAAPVSVKPEIKSIIKEFLRIDLEMDLSRKQDVIDRRVMETAILALTKLTVRLQNLPKEQSQLADAWIQLIEDMQFTRSEWDHFNK